MEPSDCHGSVTRDRHDSNLADLQPPQEAWSSRKLSVLRKKLQALASSGKTERSKNVLPIAKPKEENIRPPMAKAASSQHDPPPRTPTLKKRSTRRLPVMGKNAKRLLDKQDLRGYISEERQLESSQHNIDVDSYEATSQLLLTSEEHNDTIESPNKTRFPVDHRKRNDDDSRTDYVVDKWQRIFKERQKERSRRRSRADRTDSFGLNQSRQPPGDGASESDHSSSVDGVTRNQFYRENRPRRTSASPDEHSLFRRGRRRNSSLAGERIPLVQSNHPVIYGNAPVLSGPPKSIDSPSIQAVAPSPRAGQKRKITIASPPRSPSTPSDRSCSPKLESPTNPPATPVPPRRILREPSATFPEDSNPIREGVAPARLAQDGRRHIPPDARWTKIDRKLVNPEALAAGNERYEERTDYVIVLRVLTKKEVEAYALRTQQIRKKRAVQEQKGSSRSGPSASEDDQSDALSNDSRDSNASFERSALTSAEAPEAIDADHYDDTSDKTSSSSLRGPRDEGAGQGTATDRNDHEELEVRKSSVRALSPKPTIDTNPHKPDCGHGDAHEHTSDKPEEPRRHSSSLTSRSRSAKRQSQHGPTASNPVPDPLDTAERPLTYHEDLVLISSEDVLKSTRHSREQCKDISVTLQFCIENQAPFDSHVEEIMEQFRTLNELLKQLLFFIEPFRDEHRTAIFVIEELDILTRSTRIALIMLEKGFALSDITFMNLEGRRQTWRNLMVAFQKENPCSLSEHLKLSCRYGKELLANINAGIRSSPESNLWKSRICKTNGFRQNSTLAKSLVVDEANTEAKIDEWGRRTTLHHSRLPIPVRLVSRYERSSEEKIRRVSENAHIEDVPNNEDNSSTASTLAGSKITPTGEVNWLWLCQADIIPGYWATPWKHLFSEAVCLGAISVLLKLLETFTDATNCQYMKLPPLRFLDWLRAGKSTYPSYAHNSKGGIVASGIYESASFSAFKHAVSPIELLYSSEYQVDRSVIQTTKSVTDSICELMGLDSWLSMAGRLPEITGGPSNLLRTLPTLLQRIMTDFVLEFSNLDRTSNNGGLQMIQTIAEALLQTLIEENLSEAERLFANVALLRTAKVGLCVVRGPDTAKLRDVLKHDIQVYLA